jgi:aspartyl-tRNA(Asn)/glutamyl-tRNA(Gln) amidotransferase subunit A
LCAVTLPIPDAPPRTPAGLMLVGRNGEDLRLLRIAAAIELLFTMKS